MWLGYWKSITLDIKANSVKRHRNESESLKLKFRRVLWFVPWRGTLKIVNKCGCKIKYEQCHNHLWLRDQERKTDHSIPRFYLLKNDIIHLMLWNIGETSGHVHYNSYKHQFPQQLLLLLFLEVEEEEKNAACQQEMSKCPIETTRNLFY